MKATTGYHDRLERVKSYIYDHLDEDIDLNHLAEVACLSPYHWHRVYAAVEGETIAATVKRLRLHRAAGHLAHGDEDLESIAKRAGYGSLSAFSRAFGAVYGMPPAQYRREGSHRRFAANGKEPGGIAHEVEICDVPRRHLLVVRHQGSYMEVGKAFDRLFRTLAQHGLMRPDLEMVGLYHDDPMSVPEEALRADAGVVLEAEAIPPLEAATLAGGPCARLLHKGPYADMQPAYDWLFGHWLPASGREPGDAPVFERYLNTPQDTPPTELLTEIFLPLKPLG